MVDTYAGSLAASPRRGQFFVTGLHPQDRPIDQIGLHPNGADAKMAAL